MYAVMDDIKKMDYGIIEKELEFLDLPENIKNLWRNYFRSKDRPVDRWHDNGNIK